MNCNTGVRIGGDDFIVFVKGYGIRYERRPVRRRSELRKIVERYVVPEDVGRATESLYEVVKFIKRLRIDGGPRTRFLLVRICSALGYGTRECLKDIWPSYVSRKHEYLLYSIVFPGLGIKADGCRYFEEWVNDVLNQCTCGDNTVAYNRWRPWEEYWVDYWKRN